MYYSSVYKIFWGPKGGFERTPQTPPAYGPAYYLWFSKSAKLTSGYGLVHCAGVWETQVTSHLTFDFVGQHQEFKVTSHLTFDFVGGIPNFWDGT